MYNDVTMQFNRFENYDISKQTARVISNYLTAFSRGNLDDLIDGYTDESVLLTPAGSVRGKEHLRRFFDGFLRNLPVGFLDSFDTVRKDVEGNIAYVVWKADYFTPMATDTFVVSGGKIKTQTFTAYTPLGGDLL